MTTIMTHQAPVRTRFAPSPTGYIHLGNLRSAIFPWLIARQTKGDFILRIEDTDQERFIAGATDLIIETLKWIGLDWDEGVEVGGQYGPYIQSERKDHYIKWAQKLIEKGLAYADPYTKEELEAFRQDATQKKKAFLYRDYRPDNPPLWDGSQPLRFKVTNPQRYSWHDEVMGELSAGPEALDDIILIKSDGLPTYNFAHIVDDYEMKITHIIRGVEYIPSIPKYLAIYEALEITPPKMACLPHIMAPDGKKKLSKRDGAKSADDYRKEGVLPEALLNFLSSLGWNDGTEQEIFSREELIAKFSLDRVQKSGACFDEKRLIWMNGQWIRRLSLDDLFDRSSSFWPEVAQTADLAYKKSILALVQDRLKTLTDLKVITPYFFAEPDIDWTMVSSNKQLKKLDSSKIKTILETTIEALKDSDFSENQLHADLNQLLVDTQQKPAVLFGLIRLVISWAPFSPELNKTMAVLGKATTLRRIQNTINDLVNYSK